MSKLSITVVSCIGLMFIAGCAHKPSMNAANTVAKPKASALQHYALQPFNSIKIKGDMDVVIQSSQKNYGVSVTASNDSMAHPVSFTYHEDELEVRRVDKMHSLTHPIHVVIRARDVHRLELQGNGSLTAEGLHSPIMDVVLNTDGDVNLKGRMGIRNLSLGGRGNVTVNGIDTQDLNVYSAGHSKLSLKGKNAIRNISFKGHGWVSAYWVNSQRVTVNGSGKGYVQLAGKIEELVANLHDHASLNAKYLRANKVFVKTYDHARADINALQSQNTVAFNQSNIYYYHQAAHDANYMKTYGSVINMR